MAGLKRVQYIPEITYFYNVYENNDGKGSSKFSTTFRYEYLKETFLNRTRYEMLDSLS